MANLLPYQLTGKSSANTLLVFLHGWPDTMTLWRNIIPKVEGEYQCLNLSYPNYHPSQRLSWGLPFDELSVRIKNTVDHVDNGRAMKKMFVCHDWGAIFTYNFDSKYPNYISDIVALDVSYARNTAPKAILMSLFYQLTLVWAFLLGPFLGTYLMRGLIWLLISRKGYKPPELHTLTSLCAFPYYYLYKGLFLGTCLKRKNALPIIGYKRSCSMAFIFGLKKPFHFHDEKFLMSLQNDPKCEVHAAKSGHWITEAQPDLVVEVVLRRAKAL